jgi:hypothetical protein
MPSRSAAPWHFGRPHCAATWTKPGKSALIASPVVTMGDATMRFTTGNKSTIGDDCAAALVVARPSKPDWRAVGFTEGRAQHVR